MRTWTEETDKIFFEMWERAEPEEIAAQVNDWHQDNAKSKGLSLAPFTTARGVMFHALKHGLILQSDVDAYDKQQKSERRKRQFISAKVFQVVLERDGNKCLLCGSQNDLRGGHIKPASRGGNNQPENLQTLCASCHQDTRSSGTDFRKPYVKQWCEHCKREHYKNTEFVVKRVNHHDAMTHYSKVCSQRMVMAEQGSPIQTIGLPCAKHKCLE